MTAPDPFDIIIAHGNCYDGMTAAWVAKKHSPNAEVVFAQHHEDPPVVKGKRVLIRSREDGIDVSEIARQFPRGGGHTHAAGFRSMVPPLEIE